MIETVLEAFFKAMLSKMSLAVSMIAIFICLLVIYGLIVTVINERIYYRKTEKSMQEVDRFKNILHGFLISHYLALAKDYLGPDYFNHIEAFVYTYLVREPLRTISGEFRRRIRKNGFEKKSTNEWIDYINNCIAEDNAEFTKGLNNAYYRESIIPRVDLYKHNQKVTDHINKEYRELFEKMLEIAKNNKYKKFFKWELRFHYD